jgi:hypothetical protein
LNFKIKISTILGFLTLGQLFFTLLLRHDPTVSEVFTLEHEDTIFIMHLMTYFIVLSIEQAVTAIKDKTG